MKCPVCHCDLCTCLETFYGPLTSDDWVESLNTSLQDLADGKELEDNKAMGMAGVRQATAWEALEEAGVTPQWDEESRRWHL
jgi:hypothetical protein